jgi:hypothetical protein
MGMIRDVISYEEQSLRGDTEVCPRSSSILHYFWKNYNIYPTPLVFATIRMFLREALTHQKRSEVLSVEYIFRENVC